VSTEVAILACREENSRWQLQSTWMTCGKVRS